MSPEFKALGIARGMPYYQLKDLEVPKGDLIFRSFGEQITTMDALETLSTRDPPLERVADGAIGQDLI